jgi:hypothetical protein
MTLEDGKKLHENVVMHRRSHCQSIVASWLQDGNDSVFKGKDKVSCHKSPFTNLKE